MKKYNSATFRLQVGERALPWDFVINFLMSLFQISNCSNLHCLICKNFSQRKHLEVRCVKCHSCSSWNHSHRQTSIHLWKCWILLFGNWKKCEYDCNSPNDYKFSGSRILYCSGFTRPRICSFASKCLCSLEIFKRLMRLHYLIEAQTPFNFSSDVPTSTIMFNFGWIGTLVACVSAFTFGCRCIPNETNNFLLMSLIGKPDSWFVNHQMLGFSMFQGSSATLDK